MCDAQWLCLQYAKQVIFEVNALDNFIENQSHLTSELYMLAYDDDGRPLGLQWRRGFDATAPLTLNVEGDGSEVGFEARPGPGETPAGATEQPSTHDASPHRLATINRNTSAPRADTSGEEFSGDDEELDSQDSDYEAAESVTWRVQDSANLPCQIYERVPDAEEMEEDAVASFDVSEIESDNDDISCTLEHYPRNALELGWISEGEDDDNVVPDVRNVSEEAANTETEEAPMDWSTEEDDCRIEITTEEVGVQTEENPHREAEVTLHPARWF